MCIIKIGSGYTGIFEEIHSPSPLTKHPKPLLNWVAVKELKLSYHTGYIYIYIVNSRVSPI